MMGDDIVRSVLAHLAAWAPEEEVRRAEMKARQEWGGARVYVPKRVVDVKVQRLSVSIAAGRPLREAMNDAGVRKSQGYLYLRVRTWPR